MDLANACCFFREGYHESRVVCIKSALLVKETTLKIKINKLMDFTVSVLAAICGSVCLSRVTISRFAQSLLSTSL